LSAVLQELRIANFEGYKQQQLTFTAGLNLITGRNSSGKTTLLDAILFTLYGDVPEVEKRLLVSRMGDAGEMRAYIKFRSPVTGSIVEILRTGRLDAKGGFKADRRILRIDGKDIQVEDDEELRRRVTEQMGLSLRRFVYLAYVRQGELSRILKPDKDEMDAVLGITVLKELEQQLEAARKELEKYEGRDVSTEVQTLERTIIPQLKDRIASLSQDIERLRHEVTTLEELVRKGESPELTTLLDLIRQRDNLYKKMGEVEAGTKQLLETIGVSSLEELDQQLNNLEKRGEELERQKSQLVREVDQLLTAWSDLKGKVSSLEGELAEHTRLMEQGVTRCPTCGQHLDPEKLLKIIEEDRSRLASLIEAEREAKTKHDERRVLLEQLEEGYRKIQSAIDRMTSVKEKVRQNLGELGRLRELLSSQLQSIGESLARLSLPLTPEDPDLKAKVAHRLPVEPEQLAQKRDELRSKQRELDSKCHERDRLQAQLNEHTTLCDRLRRRLAQARIARELVERVRAAIESRRREVLRRIEVRALTLYKRLTDQHTYTSISIDPDTYTVYVHPIGLSEKIPATRVGGGHQTLIALAIRLAMLDTLKFKSLLILDEPTYGVDSDNLPQLLNYIAEASKLVSQVILVTHHGLGEEEASNIIRVYKEEGFSRAEPAFQ
jgi:exonuclease SbcC